MAYVYQVKHRVTGEFYIGSKYAVGATPENTMGYLGSPKGKRARCSRYKYLISNEKHLLDKIIVGVFDTKADALACEIEMHQKLFDDALCLNGAKQTSTKFSAVFKKEEHPMFGKVLSADSRQKMRFAKLGKPRGSHSPEHSQKISLAQLGKKLTEEHRNKLKIAAATRVNKIVACPHCSKRGGGSNITRYHFDNCAHKEQLCL